MVDQDPSYYLWHPFLHTTAEGSNMFTINITPGSSFSPPVGRTFVDQLLKEMGVGVGIRFWDVLTYRSNYHGDREKSAHWRERWPKNWRLAVTLENAVPRLPLLRHEYKETFAFSDPQELSLDDEAVIGCMIISDFKTNKDAETAKNEIQCSKRLSEIAKDYSAPNPEFLTINLGAEFVQLQVYLGKFSVKFYEAGADYALAVDAACRKAGGITSFDERANEWDELYSPSGME